MNCFCGDKDVEEGDKHQIGIVWIGGRQHAKFCDGTEELVSDNGE